nr:reverse transcriptase domain-containing protein [Tanacetum cinerariifolium]
MANLTDMLSKFMSSNTTSSSGLGTLPSNTITNPKKELKGITTRSGVAYQGPIIPTPFKVVKQGTEVTKDQVQTPSSQSTAPVQPPVVQSETQTPISEPVVTPVSASMPNLKPSIPYPTRRDNERRHDQANEQIEKFYKIFKDMCFEISFTDALIRMPKFSSTLKALIGNKEKLSEMARSPMNEHYLAVILNKLPRKLGEPGKFLIPCEIPGMDECLALAHVCASINLMPLSLWESLSLPELTPICMTLKLADRSVSKPIGITKDVSVKTDRALIDVHKGELTLHIRNEAITYNLDQTSRYSVNYNEMTANKIDVIDMACEEYSQEVLGFFDVTSSGNPTPYDDLIVSTTSPTLTPFGDSDFLLFEEADPFLGLENDPNSPKINPFYYDPEGDILLLEAILNNEPLPPLPNHEQYMPSFKKELKVCEAKTIKSFVDEPPEVELKDLPPHLEYAFLEGNSKLPVIITKELGNEEKSALIKKLISVDHIHTDENVADLLKKPFDAGRFQYLVVSIGMILACCDDDDDYDSAITFVLSTEETENSLSIGDKHLDIISATESDEVIKSSVENLVPILGEFEGIPDTMCDVHLVNNSTPLEAKDHFEIVTKSNDDIYSSDDDSLYNENIEYVEASPHDSELVSLEAAEIVIPKEEEIKDDNLREKLMNVHILIANIEALKDNPTPSSKLLTKSSSTSPKSFLEQTNTFHNSLLEFENFCFDLEDISSGSTTTNS